MDLSSALAAYKEDDESTRYIYLEIKYVFNHAIGTTFTSDIYNHIIKASGEEQTQFLLLALRFYNAE